MSERVSQSVVRTGRPLDDGEQTDGPALELDPDGRARELLRDTPHPLVSSPGAGTWAVLLERPEEGECDRPVLLQWLAPDATEPPPHVHSTWERFEAVEGEFTAVVDGGTTRLAPGESLTVESGQEHSFRNDTADTIAFRAELPSMRTVRTLYTVWGLDHDGAFGDDGGYGEPGPIQGLVLAEEAHPETTMTMAPLPVQRLLWATVGRVARALGYSGVDERYVDEQFWKRHVEQPRERR